MYKRAEVVSNVKYCLLYEIITITLVYIQTISASIPSQNCMQEVGLS